MTQPEQAPAGVVAEETRPTPPAAAEAAHGGKRTVFPEVGVVAISTVAVVADDDDDGDAVVVAGVPGAARIEVRRRKRKKGYVFIVGWRWQVKEADGSPCRTASGGYKRGFRYVKTVGTKRQAERLKRAIGA